MKISSRSFKFFGVVLATVATLLTATALFLPYLLDVNGYRTEILSALQKSLNRQVSFDTGSFAWHFGPSLEFKAFTIKERDGTTDFISARQLTVKLALIPLLEKRVEIRNLSLDQATISLSRRSDGTFNFDDLLKQDENGMSVHINKFRITKGTVQWRDQYIQKEPFSAQIHNITLTTQHITPGRKGQLKLSADIAAAHGAPTHLELAGALQLPPQGTSLRETVIDGNLTLKQAEIGKFWPYFGKFIPFPTTGGRLDIATSFQGKPQDFSAKGKLLINDATVQWPSIFHATLKPKALHLDYALKLTKQMISVSSVDLGMEGFRIKGDFKISDYLTKDPLIVTKASTPSTFRYEDVRQYVPYGIIESGTSDYIENKIKAGIFKLDTGVLEGRISQIAHMEIGQNGNTLLIRGQVSDAILSYGPRAPQFNKLKGTVELKGNSFNLIGMGGNFGTSPFTLDGSITEYNTKKTADYPVKMNISPRSPEIAWIAGIAGLSKLEYSNLSQLHLTGRGHYSSYHMDGDWDLQSAAYNLPGYVNKPSTMANNLTFSTIITGTSTKVTAVHYELLPLVVTGSGLIGYDEAPYVGFDLTTNSFTLSDALPIVPLWRKYKLAGTVQAHIKAGGDPSDMSALDYHGAINISHFSILADERLKPVTGISGTLNFLGNSMETTMMGARYGSSTLGLKAAIKSLKNPDGDFTVTSPLLYLRDINLADAKSSNGVNRLNARFNLTSDTITVKNASGTLNNSNFALNGTYLTGRNPQATVVITSTKLDLDDLKIFSSPPKHDAVHGQNTDIKLTLNAENATLGKLALNKLNVIAQQDNGTIYLQNLTTGIYGGKLTAKGRIAAGGEQGDRYDLTIDLVQADADKLSTALNIPEGVTGTLALHGNLTTRGATPLELKKNALGNIRIHATGGKIRKFSTLSKVFSILNISQLLKFKLPDMASGGMPYNSIKGSLAVKDGIITTQDVFINSNAINMSIVGTVDIIKEELNLTIGTQPLQTVDKIIHRIPIVGWLLTGKDKNLVTAYFEARGKWSDPQVTAIPAKNLGKGLLNIFVRAFELPVKLFTDTGEVILGQ